MTIQENVKEMVLLVTSKQYHSNQLKRYAL